MPDVTGVAVRLHRAGQFLTGLKRHPLAQDPGNLLAIDDALVVLDAMRRLVAEYEQRDEPT